ncbi:hypothetical protein KCU71_g3454, partial [Aureobasidium melanogenum]
MAPASNTTSSAQRINNPLIKEEWKHNVWKQSTVAQLLIKDNTMIELKSKEKETSEVRSVHKALLCFYSPYHDRLLNGDFAEGQVAPTEPLMIRTNASVLKLFFIWLYTGTIGVAPPTSEEIDPHNWFVGITKLYILADELNCIALQRSIMSAQVALSKDIALADYDVIELLSNSSLESSGLYQYFSEDYATHWNGLSDDGSAIDPHSAVEDPMPPNFAYRLLIEHLNGTTQMSGSCACCYDPCKFHKHIDEEERKAKVALRNRSAAKKRNHEVGDADTSKTRRVKTT